MLVLKPFAGGVRIDELAFAPDGGMIAAPAEGHGVMLWTAFTNGAKAELVALPNTGACRVAFTPDGKYLLAGNDELHAIELKTRAAMRYPLHRWATLHFAPSLDGSRVVVGETVPSHSPRVRFTRWPIPPSGMSSPEWSSTSECNLHTGPTFLDSKRFITTGWWPSKGVRLTVRSAASGEIASERTDLPDAPDKVVLSPDGAFLACQTRGFVHVQPVDGPFHREPQVRNDTKKHFTGIAYHPSGKYLAATSNDKTVKLYDTTTWALARTFTWNSGRMRSICFSPDGTLAAAGGDTGKVVVWDVDL